MRYQRVVWHHDDEDEPVVSWSELDERGWESRKVDEYRDGRLDYADMQRESRHRAGRQYGAVHPATSSLRLRLNAAAR